MRRQTLGKFYGLLALTAAVWGVQPLFVKLAVREITPVTLTCIRYALISADAVCDYALGPQKPRSAAPAMPFPSDLHGPDRAWP